MYFNTFIFIPLATTYTIAIIATRYKLKLCIGVLMYDCISVWVADSLGWHLGMLYIGWLWVLCDLGGGVQALASSHIGAV